MENRILVSGTDVGGSGTGRLLDSLLEASNHQLDFIFFDGGRIVRLFNGLFDRLDKHGLKAPLAILKRIIVLIVDLFIVEHEFIKLLSRTRNSHLILFHPQTMGIRRFLFLLKNRHCDIYLLDNSFFCVKSYNHRTGIYRPCQECLGNTGEPAVIYGCESYPVPYSRRSNLRFIRHLAEFSDKVRFFVQTEGQKKLLQAQIAPSRIEVVGMYADGLKSISDISFESDRTTSILFHGGIQEAKGFGFFLELAERMPDHEFVVPVSSDDEIKTVRKRYGHSNLKVVLCTWENGLEKLVRTAGIVICPSVWSAPIEGALLKSLCNNPNVAAIRGKSSFAEELPEGILIELTGDVTIDVSRLRVQKPNRSNEPFLRWYENYLGKREESIEKIVSD